jgi:hypothetical protein
MLPAASSALIEIGPALARLAAAKNQAMMSPFAMETWCAVLSVYPVDVVNMAILQMALGSDPFPDLGKVVARCQRAMASRSTQVTQADPERIGRGTLTKIAAALQMPIE